MSENKKGVYNNFSSLILLILAGEVIFLLPFVLPRIFKPTLLEVFSISNTDLGFCFSVYGIVAVFAYIFGGPLADKYSPKWLLSSALFLTGCGGVFLSTYPTLTGLLVLYGFWGLTTILLFWSSLMKSTRALGGKDSQGRAFGFLDGGRGLVSALIATLGVSVLAMLLPTQIEGFSFSEKQDAFIIVIYAFTSCCFIMSAAIFMGVRNNPLTPSVSKRINLGEVKNQLKKKEVLLQSIIILCAYSGYRVTDDFSLLAKDVLGYSDVEAAGIGTFALWLRPPVAILAGFLADRWRPSGMVIVSFVFMLISGLLMGFAPSSFYSVGFIMVVIASTCAGVYGLRGLYFAIMEEAKIPAIVTGSAVGVASMIGYLPDIYMAPLMGVFLDKHSGTAQGHQNVFLLMAGFAILGLTVSILFNRMCLKNHHNDEISI